MSKRSIMKLNLCKTESKNLSKENLKLEYINYSNLAELSHLFYDSYHNTIDDEGESVDDWKTELKSIFEKNMEN